MREIWVVADYDGAQTGTKDQPFKIAPPQFDAFMHGIVENPEPWYVHAPGHFLTRGALEWGPLAGAQWRIPSGCVLDFEGGTLELDWQAIPDDYVQSIPWHLVCSAEGWAAGKSPEEGWAAVPRGETVRNVTFIANHSKLVDRFRAAGARLLISGAILQGHAAVLENIHLEDFGAHGQEAFPLIILGCMAGPDRHTLSFLDPATHILDDDGERSRISGITFDRYTSSLSDAQVTVLLICGVAGSQVITDPWSEPGPWRQLYRRNPIISDAEGWVRDGDANGNQCQLATIYQCLGGEITRCKSHRFQSGVYGDFYSTFDLDVHHNEFLEGLRGVAQLLSPTAGDSPALANLFSSDGLKVRSNLLTTIPTEVPWHGAVTLMKLPNAPTAQHIRNVTIDDNDMRMAGAPGSANVAVRAERIEGLQIKPTNRVVGYKTPWSIYDCTGVELPPAPSSRKGCNPFRR